MNGPAAGLALLFLVALAGEAEARFPGADDGTVARPAAGLRLAQAREVEIYYDRYGRQVVVDAYTGEIIAVDRPRGYEPEAPFERRRARARELRGGDFYERRIPLGEMLRRELETHLGSGDLDDPDYRRRQRERFPREGYRTPGGEGYPAEGFPQPPTLAVPPDRANRAYPRDEGVARRAPVERAPLGAPSRAPGASPTPRAVPAVPGEDERLASVPPQDEAPPAIETVPGQPAPAIVPPSGGKAASEEVAKIQILLDRHGLSPGVIDGRMGDNVNKAISAWRDKTGSALRTYDKASVDAALAASGGDAFVQYTITPVDAAGPYVASVPEDYGEKAKLDRLGYTSTIEMLAERFHMDEGYLRALNPGVDFRRPGTVIKVASTGKGLSGQVVRIEADKGRKQVRAYDASGRLVAAYPATIGSGDTPSPSGTVTVERVAYDPEYTYNPKINFKQGSNDKVLTIPPGPNGPVGSIWIALSKPTYGIHGTPEPSKIGKTYSHGCVRLTNWDAAELAGMVKPGTVVEFVE